MGPKAQSTLTNSFRAHEICQHIGHFVGGSFVLVILSSVDISVSVDFVPGDFDLDLYLFFSSLIIKEFEPVFVDWPAMTKRHTTTHNHTRQHMTNKWGHMTNYGCYQRVLGLFKGDNLCHSL